MGVNKVVYGAVTIIDISDSTVTEDKLAKGETAYRADGEKIVGTMEAHEDVTAETNAYTTKLASLESAIGALEAELEGKASGGSGGGSDGVTMCTVKIMANGPVQQTTLHYLNENLEMVEQSVTPMDTMMGYTIRCPINSFIQSDYAYFYDMAGLSSPTLQSYLSLYLIVKGDGTFVIGG